MKLGLGTAQFGLDYGITNRRGRVARVEIERILRRAADAGVQVLDTAGAYGNSESILGEILGPGSGFRIVTKTPPLQSPEVAGPEVDRVLQNFERSLERLRQDRIYGLLLHRPADAFVPGGERLLEALNVLKKKGLLTKIGASVYTGEEIDRILAMGGVDLVQVPLSWLDQRLVASRHLEKLSAAGIEVHARSAFLQGVLLEPPERLPGQFAPLRAHLHACRERFESAGMSPLEACVAFPVARREVAAVVCGVSSLAEFEEVLAAYPRAQRKFDWNPCALGDPEWVDPSRWPKPSPVTRVREEAGSPLRIVAILQARVGSTRLPGKVLLPAAGKPLIEHMIERVRRSRRITELWLATSANPENDPLEALAATLGVKVFRGSEDDVLSRFAAVAERSNADVVVRLTGDCPLHDPQVIDEVIEHFLGAGVDYVSNSLVPTYPDGLDVEVFTRGALDLAQRGATKSLHREHVTTFIHGYHEKDRPIPFLVEHHCLAEDFSQLRWTVDEPADYDFVRRVLESLYPGNPHFGWRDVLALIAREPALLGQNAGIPRNERYFEALRRQ